VSNQDTLGQIAET